MEICEDYSIEDTVNQACLEYNNTTSEIDRQVSLVGTQVLKEKNAEVEIYGEVTYSTKDGLGATAGGRINY